MTKINVVSGDIAQVECDALITAINSGGMWFGGIDGVIMRAAGPLFHLQAGRLMDREGLTHGQTIVARGNGTTKFANVVFVVDDLEGPLNEIIAAGLNAAEVAGFKTVTLPTIRMGLMLGKVEKTPTIAVAEMLMGVQKHIATPTPLEAITFVVYNDPSVETILREAMESIQ